MRPVQDERDADRFAAFHSDFVSQMEGISCANLLRHHPQIAFDDFFYVEDERTREVVSTVCLIPWLACLDGIELRVAMLEMVLTHPDYRRRGLVSQQMQHFHHVVQERGYDLSVIEGIPYYYRQYGYAYACDHWGRDSLPAWRVPDGQTSTVEHFRVRPAAVSDIAELTELYARGMGRLGLHTLRSSDMWRFLLAHQQYPVRVIEAADDSALHGYFVTMPLEGGRGVLVAESSIAGSEAALWALQALKAEGATELQLGWPEHSTLVRVGRSLGSTPLPCYQWLIRITDVAGLLQKLAPLLERRLAQSDCVGISAELTLNLFQQAYALRLQNGKLIEARPVGFLDASMGADGGDLCIPPDAFVRLLLGYRSIDQLRDAWPDTDVRPARKHVFEVLLPRITSYLWMPYLYCGPLPQPSGGQ